MMLTPRQRDILQATANGERMDSIAAKMRSTGPAVRSESYRIKRKLGATTIQHAVAIGLRQRIIV